MQIKLVNTLFYLLPLDTRFTAPPDGLILEEVIPPQVFNEFSSLTAVAETDAKATTNLLIASNFVLAFVFSMSMQTILGSILAL